MENITKDMDTLERWERYVNVIWFYSVNIEWKEFKILYIKALRTSLESSSFKQHNNNVDTCCWLVPLRPMEKDRLFGFIQRNDNEYLVYVVFCLYIQRAQGGVLVV